jgi:RNA polymerase sigma factor (sigma-70 family)
MSDEADDFSAFYLAKRDQCLRAVAAAVGDAERAEELVAEAFARALAHWPTLKTHPSQAAWVVMTAKNHHRDRWRRQKVAGRGRDRGTLGASMVTLDGPEDRLSHTTIRAIHDLAPRQRDVLIYRIILDLDTSTTAELLGMKSGTVTTHLRRALATLRITLSPVLEPSEAAPIHASKGVIHVESAQ